VTSVDTLRL